MFKESATPISEVKSHTEETRSFIKQIRRITRRRYTPEDKDSHCAGWIPSRDLCQREGIRRNVYYAWLRDFMEAGKERLTRDTVRDATRR